MVGRYNGQNELNRASLKMDLKLYDLIAYNTTTLQIITNYDFDMSTVDIATYILYFENDQLC